MTSKVIIKKNKDQRIHGIYLVTDRDLCIYHNLTTVIKKSILGGVRIVQLREKSCSTKEFLEIAKEIKELLKNTNIPFIINDRVDIALAVQADGVHLGQSDMPLEIARKLLGDQAIIGISIEEFDQLHSIPSSANIDYIGVSPIFSTPTKTDTKNIWGIEGLKKIRRDTSLPIVAIGGINEGNAKEIISAGADSIAVVSYLCSALDPEENAKKILPFFS